jgi:hypothetical protein
MRGEVTLYRQNPYLHVINSVDLQFEGHGVAPPV